MNTLNIHKLFTDYLNFFENTLKGRRILFNDIESLIKNLSAKFKKEILGFSENKIPIYKITIGNGKTKILVWSQMHGNESTGTKAVFDFFNFIEYPTKEASVYIKTILENCTIEFIPMLNPDGAILFTRENASKIDLNRDAVNQKAIESRILRKELESFNPSFCFNLHDQRSIFNVEGTSNPATISFLAPSEDKERTLTKGRKETMSVIVAMNSVLQKIIPNQIGRYTDEFYPTATGDNFQKLGYNTILIECGHFKDDYDRDITRKFNFIALLQGFYFLATANNFNNYQAYFDIPNNNSLFLDKIYKNVKMPNNMVQDIGIQYVFKYNHHKLERIEHIEKIGDLTNYHTYTTIKSQNLDFNQLKLSNS
ncbi:MAG: M14 family zinc carboxypeptidase [Lutibacter sp.]|uniref:M14 family zinc carboxypeptidase n=1 Tax=Lutibacter sp. TaxID=1925666 RepID=UPI00299EFEAB|nr:M14 family zinc carboxypeptidase [Lutibacter sp.]MDX1828069.1 M14 family zinc carboxypeptidase [Lutibacter sp.]